MIKFSRMALPLALAVASITLASRGWANSNGLFCQFNKGRTTAASTVDNGGAFALKWADGPKQSYVWVGSNADMHNLTDSLGGRWHYSDHRNGKGFSIWNLDNRNLIECD